MKIIEFDETSRIHPKQGEAQYYIRYVQGKHKAGYTAIQSYEVGYFDEPDKHLRKIKIKTEAVVDKENSTDTSTRFLIRVSYAFFDDVTFGEFESNTIFLRLKILLFVPESED